MRPLVSHSVPDMKTFKATGAMTAIAMLLLLLAGGNVVAQVEQTVPMVDRPLSMKKGHTEFGIDLTVDLGVDTLGKQVSLGSGYIVDRCDGVSISYGVSDRFEIGAAAEMLWWQKGKGLSILGGIYLFAKWAFMPWLGVEIGLQVPSKVPMERLVIRRGSITIGIPFKYAVVPGILAVHARPDVFIGFAKTGYYGLIDSPQITVFVDAGLTVNITPELFLDVSAGVGKPMYGFSDRKDYSDDHLFNVQGLKSWGTDPFVPLSIWLGYTVLPSLDLGVAFTFADLYGNGVDERNITVTSAFRF